MKKGYGWLIADCIISVITGVGGLIGLVTSAKAASAQQELMDFHLEEKYGLTPKNKED